MRANRADVDFADEVHFNKSSGVGHGTEVWIHPNTSAGNRKFAELASRFVSGALGIRDRGIKENKDFVFLKSTRMPSTIPEIAFIDNAGDAAALARPGWAKEVGEALARARIETSG